MIFCTIGISGEIQIACVREPERWGAMRSWKRYFPGTRGHLLIFGFRVITVHGISGNCGVWQGCGACAKVYVVGNGCSPPATFTSGSAAIGAARV